MSFIVSKCGVDDTYPKWCVINTRTGETLIWRFYSKACAEQAASEMNE